MEQRLAFFLHRSSSRYIQLPLWVGVFGLDQHSCRGSRISPVFVSHSSVAWPLLFPPAPGLDLPAAGTNPRLFWTRGHKQCGQPTICIPVPYLCQARGCCAEGPALQGKQTEHCVQSRVDKHVSLWVFPPFICLYRKLGSHVGSTDLGAHV